MVGFHVFFSIASLESQRVSKYEWKEVRKRLRKIATNKERILIDVVILSLLRVKNRGDEKLPSYMGIVIIHYKDPY